MWHMGPTRSRWLRSVVPVSLPLPPSPSLYLVRIDGGERTWENVACVSPASLDEARYCTRLTQAATPSLSGPHSGSPSPGPVPSIHLQCRCWEAERRECTQGGAGDHFPVSFVGQDRPALSLSLSQLCRV